MDVGRGLTHLRVELGISAKHGYGLKYFVSDIMCGARTKKTWASFTTRSDISTELRARALRRRVCSQTDGLLSKRPVLCTAF